MDNVFGENIPTDWTAFYQEWLFNSVQKRADVSSVGRWGSLLSNREWNDVRQESVPYELFFAPPETEMVATGFGWRKQLKKKVDLSDF